MKCSVCNDCTSNKGNEYNDCIIEFLECIKVHYTSFKTKLNDSETTIEQLKTTNTDLLQTIEKLKTELSLRPPDGRKKRKTNSFDSVDDSEDLVNVQAVLPDKSTDDLNEAIHEENWDDTFFAPPTQTQSLYKPEEKPVDVPKPVETYTKEVYLNTYRLDVCKTPRLLSLSPKGRQINQITPLKCSPEETVLPRRDKVKSSKKISHNENKNNVSHTSKWNSKEQIVKKNQGALEKCWSMSFLQPIKVGDNKSSSIVDVSPNDQKENRSPLAAKDGNSRLRQTKLNFNPKRNEKHGAEFDDTFCEEIVAASPTSVNVASNETGKLSKMMSLRKIPRQKADNSIFVSSKKKGSSLSPEIDTESAGDSPTKGKIKTEPVTVKKNAKTNLFPRVPLSPVKIEPGATQCSQDDSSFLILPSQPDDVICLEETEEHPTSSSNLLQDMILQDDNFSDLLREIEAKRERKLEKDKQLKTDKSPEDKKSSVEFKTPTNQRKLPVFDCKECETYFKYIGKDLSDEEIQKRLRNCCKHKKPISLHHTPEGFWDPYFRPPPPGDPRNETLIDTRFVDKKK